MTSKIWMIIRNRKIQDSTKYNNSIKKIPESEFVVSYPSFNNPLLAFVLKAKSNLLAHVFFPKITPYLIYFFPNLNSIQITSLANYLRVRLKLLIIFSQHLRITLSFGGFFFFFLSTTDSIWWLMSWVRW